MNNMQGISENAQTMMGREVIPNVSEIAEDSQQSREPASVTQSPDGQPMGVDIHLTVEDLRKLGIILDGVEEVVPVVANGAVLIEPVR